MDKFREFLSFIPQTEQWMKKETALSAMKRMILLQA